jgi:hypothetical protein
MAPLGGFHDPARPPLLDTLARRRLTWFPEAGVGYFPVNTGEAPYDEAYFNKYAEYAETRMGRGLNLARMALVNRHYRGDLVDIGIGAGSFVLARPRTWGFDINPAGVQWLKGRGVWWNPHERGCAAASMWDVLEHMPDFPAMLARVSEHLFVSIPVFTDAEDVLSSRHFRTDEHVWYFRADGFVRLMSTLGWRCEEVNEDETRMGRDSIASFAFRRRGS